jgi:hypothetical protein
MSLPPPSSVFAEANPICLISPIGSHPSSCPRLSTYPARGRPIVPLAPELTTVAPGNFKKVKRG